MGLPGRSAASVRIQPAPRLDIICKQGITFRLPLAWRTEAEDGTQTPVDLTGKQLYMQVRKSHKSPVPLLDLSTLNSGITVTSPATGTFVCHATADVMATVPAGTWVWDLEAHESNGNVVPVLEGSFTVEPEVTRG